MDHVSAALWVGGFSALVVTIAGGLVTWANRDSQTVVLGFTALVGALALFIGQLVFQLRGSTAEEAVGTQLIVNKTAPAANALQPANMSRAAAERDAATWLAAKSPDAFKDDGKLTRDLLVFSILHYFITDEVDWRMKRTSYRFPAFGPNMTMTEFQPQSAKDVYSISEADIRNALRAGRNGLAEAPLTMPSFGLRLPPGSQLTVFDAEPPATRTTLTIRNPITRVDFVIVPSSISGGLRPPTPDQKGFAPGQATLAGLPDAEYSLYLMKISIQSSFAGTRAHHPDIAAHRAWVERLHQGLGSWFRSESRP